MDPSAILSVANSVLKVGLAIKAQVETAAKNFRCARRLAGRVEQICLAIKGLSDRGELPTDERYYHTLIALKKVLDDCLTFLEKFRNKWRLKRFLRAGKYRERFEQINEHLLELIPQLNLGVTVAVLFNQDAHHAELKEDLAHIRRVLKEGAAAEVDESLGGGGEGGGGGGEGGGGGTDVAEDVSLSAIPHCELRALTDWERLPVHSVGTLYRATLDGEPVLVESFSAASEDDRRALLGMIAQTVELRNAYVLGFRAVCVEGERLHWVTEGAGGGDILSFFATNRVVFERRHGLIRDLAQGLVYLHSQGRVHGDISARQAWVGVGPRAKWRGVGLSAMGSESGLAYRAPEQFLDGDASAKTDVYAFGVLIWQIWTEAVPYQDQDADDIRRALEAGERLPMHAAIPSSYEALLRRCWDADPLLRPSMRDLLSELNTIEEASLFADAKRSFEAVRFFRATDKPFMAALHCERAARLGDARAMMGLGLMYSRGEGVSPNLEQAFRCIYLSATASDRYPTAMFNLARLYGRGEGVQRSPEDALHWYQAYLDCGPDATSPELCERAAKKIEEIRASLSGGDTATRASTVGFASMTRPSV